MHVEVPKKGALASFKAFAGEYAMIVISILTALALEHAATNWHRKHQAHEAEQRIEAEIAYNLDQLKQSLAINRAELKKYQELRDLLRDGINNAEGKSEQAKAGVNAEINRQLNARMLDKLHISISTPTLRREAWEVAVASQAASWIDSAPLQHYSGIYALQRDITSAISASVSTISGPRVLGALPQIQLHRKQNATDMYEMMSELCFSLQMMQNYMEQLEKGMKESAHKA